MNKQLQRTSIPLFIEKTLFLKPYRTFIPLNSEKTLIRALITPINGTDVR